MSGQYAYITAAYSGKLTAVDISNPANPTLAGSTAFSNNLVGGATATVAGGYVYVASKNLNSSTGNDDGVSGNSLTVVDIHTNPAHPVIVGKIRDPRATASRPGALFGAYGVAVSGNYAYVAAQGLLAGQPSTRDTSTGSFAVYDISAHGNPVPMGHILNSSLTGSAANALQHACSVYVSGNYAYVTAAYSDRLTIIDISNPNKPTIVSSLSDGKHNIHFDVDVVVAGSYAYLVDQLGGSSGRLTVVNVSNPAAPSIVGSVAGPELNGAYHLHVAGDFAYVTSSGSATVAAVDIANPAHPQIVGSLTDPAHLTATTGLDLDPTATFAIASSFHLPGESNPTRPPYPGQTGGPSNTGTISTISLDPNPIAVAITSGPPSQTRQNSASFSFSASDAIASLSCRLDGAPFTPCTSEDVQAYSSLPVGLHSFSVQATDAAGRTASTNYAWMVTSPPGNTLPPRISGTPTQGQTLTAVPGTFSGVPAPALAFQWIRCHSPGGRCASIAGATATTYVLTAADVGQRISVAMTAANSAGSAAATSQSVGPVAAVIAYSHAVLVGLAKRRAQLAFTVLSGPRAPWIKSISVARLPRGLALIGSPKRLANAVDVDGPGQQPLRFAAKLRHGWLTIRLPTTSPDITVTVGRGAIRVSRSLAAKVRHRKVRRLRVRLSATNASHQTVSSRLAVSPR